MNWQSQFAQWAVHGALILFTKNGGDKHLGTIEAVGRKSFQFVECGISNPYSFDEIKTAVDKNLIFKPTRFVLNAKEFNVLTNKIIEGFKSMASYELYTKSAHFSRTGAQQKPEKKEKFVAHHLDILVYDWLKPAPRRITICPLALLNDEYLLCIHEKCFCIMDRKGSILFEIKESSLVELLTFLSKKHGD